MLQSHDNSCDLILFWQPSMIMVLVVFIWSLIKVMGGTSEYGHSISQPSLAMDSTTSGDAATLCNMTIAALSLFGCLLRFSRSIVAFIHYQMTLMPSPRMVCLLRCMSCPELHR